MLLQDILHGMESNLLELPCQPTVHIKNQETPLDEETLEPEIIEFLAYLTPHCLQENVGVFEAPQVNIQNHEKWILSNSQSMQVIAQGELTKFNYIEEWFQSGIKTTNRFLLQQITTSHQNNQLVLHVQVHAKVFILHPSMNLFTSLL